MTELCGQRSIRLPEMQGYRRWGDMKMVGGLSCGGTSEYPTPWLQVPRRAFESLSRLEHAVIYLFFLNTRGLPRGRFLNVFRTPMSMGWGEVGQGGLPSPLPHGERSLGKQGGVTCDCFHQESVQKWDYSSKRCSKLPFSPPFPYTTRSYLQPYIGGAV